MKKSIFLILFICISLTSFSQVWLDVFAVRSAPSSDFFYNSDIDVKVDDDITLTVPGDELFTKFANEGYGAGLNIRYEKEQLIVGMEISYVAYDEATQYLQLQMFRIGPTVEYFFLPNSLFHPYVGIEGGLQQMKAIFDKDVVDRLKLSNTYFGIGARAGFVYMFTESIAFRFGAKYMYLQKFPYIDVNAGIAINLGDF